MYCGLHFIIGSGEALQTVIDTASLNVFARASKGNTFGAWRFLCGPGGDPGSGEDGGSGGSGGAGEGTGHAEVADRAYALSSPITIQFTGDVSGSATFDGSKNVISSLSLTGEGDTGNSVQGVGGTTVVMATPSFTVPEGGTWFVCPVKDNCGIMRGSNFYEYLENVASGTALTHGQRLFNADSGRNEIRTLAGPVLCVKTA